MTDESAFVNSKNFLQSIDEIHPYIVDRPRMANFNNDDQLLHKSLDDVKYKE